MSLKGKFWKLFYKIKSNSRIIIGEQFSRRRFVDVHVSDNGTIEIGNDVFLNRFCTIAAKDHIRVGNSTIFGEGVRVYDSNHRFSDATIAIYEQGFSTGGISIGNDCWIGSHSVILKGTTIGDHSIIGAGCIIDFDVPAWTIIKADRSMYKLIERRHQ